MSMITQTIKAFAPLYFFALFLTGCSKDLTPVTRNPCDDQAPLTAGIRIEEDFDGSNTTWPYYFTDTVCTTTLRFTAVDSLAGSYVWYI